MEVTNTSRNILIYSRDAFIKRFEQRISVPHYSVEWHSLTDSQSNFGDIERGALLSVVFSAGDIGLGESEMSCARWLHTNHITPLIFFCTGNISESDGATMVVYAKTLLELSEITTEPRHGDEDAFVACLSELLTTSLKALLEARQGRVTAEKERLSNAATEAEIRKLQEKLAAHLNARLRCDAISKHGLQLEGSVDQVLTRALSTLSEQSLQQSLRLACEERLKTAEQNEWPSVFEGLAYEMLRRWQLTKIQNMILDLKNVAPVDIDVSCLADDTASRIEATIRPKNFKEHLDDGTVQISATAGIASIGLLHFVIPVLTAPVLLIPAGLAAAAYTYISRAKKSDLSQFISDNSPSLTEAARSTFVATQAALRDAAGAVKAEIRTRTTEAIRMLLSVELLSDNEAKIAARRVLELQSAIALPALPPAAAP